MSKSKRRKQKPAGSKAERQSKPKAQETAPTAAPAPPYRSPYDRFRENAEALIVAVVLAVVIRHFAVEAFEIPTGSMAPSLYGIHAWTTCPNCEFEYNLALRSDSDSGKITVPYHPSVVYEGPCANAQCGEDLHFLGRRGGPLAEGGEILCGACETAFAGKKGGYRRAAVHRYPSRCPSCQYVFRDAIDAENITGGHKILVTKFAYALDDPERWDVIVFTFDQWKNYIKRLVGLPGEHVELWDGDVYVNGEIERKYKHAYIQDVLWQKIADSSRRELHTPSFRHRGAPHPPAWQEMGLQQSEGTPSRTARATWDDETLRWRVNSPENATALSYTRGFDNFYSYNLLAGNVSGTPGNVQVGDKKVEFTARPMAGGSEAWIGAEIREGDYAFQLRLPIGGGQAILERMAIGPEAPLARASDGTLRQSTDAHLALNRDARIALEIVDDRAAAYLDGELILAIEYTSLPSGTQPRRALRMPSEEPSAHFIHLVANRTQAEIHDIQVYRDMYYIGHWNNASLEPIGTLGPDQYLALGDNGPSSSDGRYWGHVPDASLMGKALLVFWPAWPTNFQCKFIR